MSLIAAVCVEYPDFTLEVELTADRGAVVCVLGPNGAGKSTLLAALAGLAPLARGRIELDGRLLADAAAGLAVPPERRPIGVVFQDYLLFPHLSALDNVAYGLRSRGLQRRREIAQADLFEPGATRRPHTRPRRRAGAAAARRAARRARRPHARRDAARTACAPRRVRRREADRDP